MTLAEFAVATGFYTAPEVESALYTDAVWRLERHVLVPFWDHLTDHRHHFGVSSGQIRHVRDPLYRVVHHLIARSIVPRERSRDKVNLSDLFHLFCILTGRHCNLAACLAMYFEGVHHRQFRGLVYGGCFVTVIARNLGVDLIHLGEGLGPGTFGRANLLPMQVLRQFGPDQWSLVSDPADQVAFVSEPIPADDAIPPYREASHGVPDPDFPQPQPRHPPHPIIGQPQVQPPQHHQQPQQPPQHPQHVYADMTPGLREFAQRTDRRLARMEQSLDWIIRAQMHIAQMGGYVLPPPPVDDDDDA